VSRAPHPPCFGCHARTRHRGPTALSGLRVPHLSRGSVASQMVLKKHGPRISIPLNRPALVGAELRYIGDALRRGQISGDGFYTRRASAHLEHLLGVPRVLLTPSCTHALELAFLLMPTKPGQEVLCPSFTF